MTTISTTLQTYQQIGIREDLSNIIYDISPTETPFMNGAGRDTAKNTLFEWQTDELAAVNTANAQIEGDDITSFPAVDPTVRVGSYTQISRELLLVSGTAREVDTAGRNDELSYQLSKKGAELKRSMEAMSLENLGGVAGDASTARVTAGLGAWVKTNTNFNTADGADPTYTSGVPPAGRTDGTLRAITEEMFKDVCQQIWQSGGTLKKAMANAVNKQNISQFTGIASQQYQLNSAETSVIVAAADIYVSDFGNVTIFANRFMRERDVYFCDSDYYSFSYLRPFRQETLSKSGDADKRMLIVEWGLRIKQEAALGGVFDLDSVVQ